MKRLLVAVALVLALAGISHGATPVRETAIGMVGGAFRMTPPTGTWTKMYLSTAAVQGPGAGQAGIIVNNPSANTGSLRCVVSEDTPTVPVTHYSIEIQPGENPFRPIGGALFLWCVSATSPETFIFQFTRQEP